MLVKRLILVVTLALSFAGAAFSQTPEVEDPDASVLTRRRPALDARGIPIGGFYLFPKLTYGVRHNDNIFADTENPIEDFINDFTPALALESNWNNHLLRFDADADVGRYRDRAQENYEDYRAEVTARVDISSRSRIQASAQHIRGHEQRGSPDDANGIEPTIYHRTMGRAAFSQTFNRVTLDVESFATRVTYDDVRRRGGIIDNSDRARVELDGSLRLAYAFMPQFSMFFRAAGNSRDYDRLENFTEIDRTSRGYNVQAGTDFKLSGVTRANLFAGYILQDPEDERLIQISEPAFGGALTWDVSPLTAVRGELTRQSRETVLDFSTGVVFTEAAILVDHELLRTLLLTTEIRRTYEDFIGIPREDENWDIEVGATYLMNRYVYLRFGYRYLDRQSSRPGASFTQNSFLIRADFQL